jgi:hypothetical protein
MGRETWPATTIHMARDQREEATQAENEETQVQETYEEDKKLETKARQAVGVLDCLLHSMHY